MVHIKTESPYIREDEVAELIEPLKPVEDRVQYWGKIDDREELAKILSSSDVFSSRPGVKDLVWHH